VQNKLAIYMVCHLVHINKCSSILSRIIKGTVFMANSVQNGKTFFEKKIEQIFLHY